MEILKIENLTKIYGKDIFNFDDDKLAIFRRRQVGLIYQFYNLIPILNVEENIALPLALDKTIIENNNGTIDVESDSNGTKFTIKHFNL